MGSFAKESVENWRQNKCYEIKRVEARTISLYACLRWSRSICSSLGLRAQVLGLLVGFTAVCQLITRKLGDDLNVLRRAMVKRACGPEREQTYHGTSIYLEPLSRG